MAVKKDERMVKSKRNKDKLIKKVTYKCEGSYVDINGDSHRYHKRGFISAEEAKEWERTYLAKAKLEVDTSITFYELYIIYMDRKNSILKNRSYYDINKMIEKHILPFWKDIKVSSITLHKIENYQNVLLNTKKEDGSLYSNESLKNIQMRLKSILKYGYENGYITDYKVQSFKIIKRGNELKKEMLFWQPDEYNKFISVVDEPIYVAFFNVLYWCGLRLGEALALTWNDISFDDKSIRINKSYTKHKRQTTAPKTANSYRTVIMPNKCFESVIILYEMQKKIIGYSNDKLLFYFINPLDENSIRKKKDRWIEKANVKRIRTHDLRHSHVSLLISLGFNAFDIAKRLGHTVEMVNNVYGHWFQDAQQKMVDKLNNLV